MTYSIVAFQPDTGEFGVAVATRRTAVGARVPWVRSADGAVASQAISNPGPGVTARDRLERAGAAEPVLAAEEGPDPRQGRRPVDCLGAVAARRCSG